MVQVEVVLAVSALEGDGLDDSNSVIGNRTATDLASVPDGSKADWGSVEVQRERQARRCGS